MVADGGERVFRSYYCKSASVALRVGVPILHSFLFAAATYVSML